MHFPEPLNAPPDQVPVLLVGSFVLDTALDLSELIVWVRAGVQLKSGGSSSARGGCSGGSHPGVRKKKKSGDVFVESLLAMLHVEQPQL